MRLQNTGSLMEENFFIESPEKLENNFYNKHASEEFQRQFKEKSKEIVKVMSMKNRHVRKLNKKKAKSKV